ncbi:MAG: type I restriction-modification system subunit M [Anaerococcus sp.]
MADRKKEQQRDELHRAIWSIADDLRGSVDGWDFKSYVLGTMFYRYISENLTNYINKGEHEAGDESFDYALISDEDALGAKEELVKEKGFFILPSHLFSNIKKYINENREDALENLNIILENTFESIENSAMGRESEDDFKGLFDDYNVNSNKLGSTVKKRNATLIKLINGIGNMSLASDYQDNTIDAFGDAYEFLMAMYASKAGKSGGEFFTPQEVSELLTRIATYGKTQINKAYDPCVGSGSLLLQAAKILGKDNVRNGFYGQEINITTYNLCRINMFLHDIGYDKFNIACEDTLVSPQHWDDEPFEVIVSNPPYSIKWEGDKDPTLINDPRFSPAGVLAPKSKADLAFVMHMLSWLSSNGTAAIVCFPGVMYRGGAEKKIRKYLIDNNFVDCIIQLPENLFFGTSIATCIMVLKKNKSDSKTLFIDASEEFVKVTNNNKLTQENIIKITETFGKREEIKHFSHLAKLEEIKEEDYNLSVNMYVEPEDLTEKIDIDKLNESIKKIVSRQEVLRGEIDKIIAEIEGDKDE